MSKVLLTVSAVIRTPCSSGWPPVPALRLSGDPVPDVFAAADAAAVCPPKPDVPFVLVPDCEREPKPLDDELLLFWERRSLLAVAEVPDPGASWFSALSSRPEDDPPMNISVSTRAISRPSPYFTR